MFDLFTKKSIEIIGSLITEFNQGVKDTEKSNSSESKQSAHICQSCHSELMMRSVEKESQEDPNYEHFCSNKDCSVSLYRNDVKLENTEATSLREVNINSQFIENKNISDTIKNKVHITQEMIQRAGESWHHNYNRDSDDRMALALDAALNGAPFTCPKCNKLESDHKIFFNYFANNKVNSIVVCPEYFSTIEKT